MKPSFSGQWLSASWTEVTSSCCRAGVQSPPWAGHVLQQRLRMEGWLCGSPSGCRATCKREQGPASSVLPRPWQPQFSKGRCRLSSRPWPWIIFIHPIHQLAWQPCNLGAWPPCTVIPQQTLRTQTGLFRLHFSDDLWPEVSSAD